MKKYAVIVAGGSGVRMATSIPKQFLHLNGKPVLWYTVNTFLQAFNDLEIIIVLGDDYLETGKNILEAAGHQNRISFTTGGPSRFHSVKNGLQQVRTQSVVFVHDGVRCLLTTNLIHRCYANALEYGNAVPAMRAVDSIRIESVLGNEIIDREKVRIIQTPQTFYSDIIKAGYEQEFSESFTDDASVVERMGVKIHLVEGEARNIKITNPIDIMIAEKILEESY